MIRVIEFFINKPILNHMFLIFLTIVSIYSYINIPKEIFPPSNLDKIQVSGSYVGASADMLDSMAVVTIEDKLKNLTEVESIDSLIKSGVFSVTATLKDGEDIDSVVSDIKDIVTATRRDLPSDMDEPTVKRIKHSFPLVTVAISAEKEKKDLLAVAEKLKTKFSAIKDLNSLAIRGDADKELIFTFDEKKIDAYGLNKLSVISAVSNLSTIFPIGIIEQRGSHIYLSTNNGEKDIEKIKNSLIKIGTTRVYIKDIANVEYKLSDSSEISHFNGKPNISISISKGEDGNSIALVKDIKKILAEYKEIYPEFVFDTYTDTSIWIKNRLNTVVSNILFGLMLVFLTMYIFINKRIAFVVAIGIPVSFMIGIISANLLGYSLNMLSLLGALIALGMLVDEAIVVAENIYRHLEMGKEPKQAALDGAKEMLPAVITATATTIFAFLPLLIMSGEVGVFIKILPIMISILILSSLVEAFFFLPLHAKDILKVSKDDSHSNIIWDKLNWLYNKILGTMLSRKKLSLFLLILSIIVITGVLMKNSKFQFMPKFDTTQLYVNGKVDVNSTVEDTEAKVTKLEEVLLKDIDKDSISSITSVTGFRLDSKNQPDVGDFYFTIFVNLHERAPSNFFDKYINPYLSPEYDASVLLRDKDAESIAKEIQDAIKVVEKEFDEISVIVPQTGMVKYDVELALVGKQEAITKSIDILKGGLKSIDGVHTIGDDTMSGLKELKFRVNEYGYSLGIDESYIFSALKPFFLKGEYSKMFDENGIVRIKFESTNKDNLSSVNNFLLDIPNSAQKVRLSDVAEFIYKETYTQIVKDDGDRISTVFASLDKKSITSAEVFDKIKDQLDQIKALGVKIKIKGEQEKNKEVQKEMGFAALIAILLIFISLVWMFDSIVKSLIIIGSIPLSLLGVYLGHMIMGINITMPSMIGIVGLTGVIVNDGLIMLDFIKKTRDKASLLAQATLRLRPILLTSLTTVLGLSTLMFFASGQSLILQPMAVTLGFGLLWSTVINLYYVPLMYAVIYKVDVEDKDQKKEEVI
jgi:multidrug efflux pump subunit AcrB